jgi:hypothetical protein
MSEITLTPDKLVSILKMSNEEAERALFDRLRWLDRSERLTHAERGLILRNVEEFKLFEQRIDPSTGTPCTFDGWLRLASPWAYSSCRQALRDVKDLSDINDSDLAQVTPSNFPILKKLSTQVRNDPSILEAAKTQPTEKLVEQIRRDHPMQHIECTKTLRFNLDESDAATVEEVLDIAMQKGAHNRNESLLMVSIEARDSWRYEQEILKMPEEDVTYED